MEQLKTSLAVTEKNKFSALSLQKPTAERQAKAAEAYMRLMQTRPEYGSETDEYMVGFTETLSYLSDEELAWVTHPRDGLHTVCKFLPTAADLFDFLRKKREPFDKFKAFGKSLAEREPPELKLTESEIERRKRIVMETLGYNPLDKFKPVKRVLENPTEAEVRGLKLETPAAPVSEELKKLLWEQGYFTLAQDTAA